MRQLGKILVGAGSLAAVLLIPSLVSAQDWPEYFVEPSADEHDLLRGPGHYLSILKLVLIIIALLIWVRMADWVHRDTLLFGERTKMPGEIWNPITVFPFFVAFLLTISFPMFWLSYPLLLAAAIMPPIIYSMQRNAKLPAEERVLTSAHMKRVATRSGPPPRAPLPQDIGPQVEFKASGSSPQDSQARLIMARQNPAFPSLKALFDDALTRRAESILLDQGMAQVGVRYHVDGVWHELPPMDPAMGDPAMHALKTLASMNPMDKRSKQSGSFQIATIERKAKVELTSQGVASGERMLLKLVFDRKGRMNLHQLGMLPAMEKRLKSHLNQPGLVVVSCMPGDGMTSTWNATLEGADRVVRDFVGLWPETHHDTNVENIDRNAYDPKDAKKAGETLRTLMLKQPEAVILPEPQLGDLLAPLLKEIVDEKRFVATRIAAKSSAEAILRLSALPGVDRAVLSKTLSCVVYSRLVRRLCDGCKQPFQPSPALLQKLGVKPGTVEVLFKEYQPPPPEELVDEKGRPIEVPICPTCGGLGYVGRIAIFELMEINDALRSTITNQPKLEAIQQASRRSGNLGLQEEGIQLVLAGVTSLPELQRVLKA